MSTSDFPGEMNIGPQCPRVVKLLSFLDNYGTTRITFGDAQHMPSLKHPLSGDSGSSIVVHAGLNGNNVWASPDIFGEDTSPHIPPLKAFDRLYGGKPMSHEQAHSLTEPWEVAAALLVTRGKKNEDGTRIVATVGEITWRLPMNDPPHQLVKSVLIAPLLQELMMKHGIGVQTHEDQFMMIDGRKVWRAFYVDGHHGRVGYDTDPLRAVVRAALQHGYE